MKRAMSYQTLTVSQINVDGCWSLSDSHKRFEDKMLQEELEACVEYAGEVRHRLAPGFGRRKDL
jgi:hypothetical protein